MDEKSALVAVVGLLVSVSGYLGKRAMDKNTDEIKGLRGDVGRLFEREEKTGLDMVAVQGDIKRIDERCARNHKGD